uniref:Uncharacterized protein n=1 Tax=Rhizophora mucronata TaxID=61149 RepID=A0A2P2Q884_RHIMU
MIMTTGAFSLIQLTITKHRFTGRETTELSTG